MHLDAYSRISTSSVLRFISDSPIAKHSYQKTMSIARLISTGCLPYRNFERPIMCRFQTFQAIWNEAMLNFEKPFSELNIEAAQR